MTAVLAASCATPFIEVKSVELATVADGAWQGSYTGTMGSAAVTVDVAGGQMYSIGLDSFESSRVILRAVQDALEKGVRR